MPTNKLPDENPPGPIYGTINDVPEPWRVLNGGRLSLRQVNHIMTRAYELGRGQDMVEDEPPVFMPDYGLARAEFKAAHELVGDLWAAKE